ncbi:META domain-containing protein [Psychromonas sp. PT13]|uniref:META domain-containing protein n=1 Tax=Psychromonas sp. PT13 TaxID=3439547 RepID=UPI003EBC71D3
MKSNKLIIILLSSLFLFACETTSTAGTQPITLDKIQHQWVLTKVDDQVIDPAINSTFNISTENKASGNLACNLFFGEVSVQDNKLKIAKMGSTRKMCQTQAMQIESSITSVLTDWSEVAILDKTLTLVGASHQLTYQLNE